MSSNYVTSNGMSILLHNPNHNPFDFSRFSFTSSDLFLFNIFTPKPHQKGAKYLYFFYESGGGSMGESYNPRQNK